MRQTSEPQRQTDDDRPAVEVVRLARSAARLAREAAATAAGGEIDDADAMAAVGAALDATDQLAAAAVALLGCTTHRGVIASEGMSTSIWLRVFGGRTTGDERMLTATVERLADLPTVYRWFMDGAVSWPTVRGIVAAVRNLTREQRAWLDAELADHGDALCRLEADRIVTAAERLADQARPDLHEAREQRAFSGRRFAVHPRLDGSSHVTGDFDAEDTATLLAGLAAVDDLEDGGGDVDAEQTDAEQTDAEQTDAEQTDAERASGLDARRRRRQRSNADRLVGIVAAHLAGRRGGRARPSMIVVTDIRVFDDRGDSDDHVRPSEWSSTAQLLWNCHAGPVELTAAAARRLACDATLRHVLVDGDVVLGATATHPVVSASLRAALVVRDGGCRFAGCRAPVDQCDNHHLVFKVHGGRTALENLALLCSAHHHAVHDGGWTTTLHADGTIDFTRRGITVPSHPRTADHLAATRPPPGGRPRRRRLRRRRAGHADHPPADDADAAAADAVHAARSDGDTHRFAEHTLPF
jgi:hypothetical protein